MQVGRVTRSHKALRDRFVSARDCCLTCGREDRFRTVLSRTDGCFMVDTFLFREIPAQSCRSSILPYIILCLSSA